MNAPTQTLPDTPTAAPACLDNSDTPASLMLCLLQQIPTAVAYVDSHQRFRFANRAYADWFAPEGQAIVGRSVREVLGEAGYAEVRQIIEDALAGRTTTFERRLAGPTGDRWIEAVYVPRFGADGQVIGYCFQAHDLTRRHGAELELARSERRLRTVIDNAPAMIAYWDPEGHLVHANAQFAEALGLSGKTLMGKTSREILGDETYARLQPQCVAASRGQASAFEQSLPGRDGLDSHFQVTLLPDRDGPVQHGVFLFAMDITGPRRLIESRTRDLLAAKDAAEAANRVKDEIVANVSHELRTPLHAIASFASLGLTHAAPHDVERHRVYFDRIRVSATRLNGFVDDLLRLARLGSGEVSPRPEPTDLVQLARDVVAELEALLAQGGHRVSVDCAAPSAVAEVDRHLLRRVLLNLLSNARKFSPAGSEITVSIGHAPDDVVGAPRHDVCRVAVADRGPGIPEEELEAIFTPFVQSSRTDRKAGGTGLGLPIIRRIVALHSGWIRALNRPEGGALFEIEIPVRHRPAPRGDPG